MSDEYISQPKKPFKYISCFSGIEAASVAWDELGWQPQAFCEIEPFPSAVLAQRYPEVPNLGDITKVNWDEWKDKDIDLIIGGSPCQSFSVAGKRLGLDDPRGNLAIEFIRIIDTIRPRWFILENVAGLLSADGGRDFGSLLALMGECGYGFSYRILDSQHFGVPQRRRRVFIVGHLGGDWRHSAAVLFESSSLQRNTPKALRIQSEEDATRLGEGFDSWFDGIDSTSIERRGIVPDTYGIGGGQAAQWSNPAPNLAPTLHCQSDCALVAHESQPEEKRVFVDAYHASIDEDKTSTLSVGMLKGNLHCVGEPMELTHPCGTEIWNFDAKNSNSMKSSNPDSGLQNVTEGVAPTLTAVAPNPTLNQGGIAIVQDIDEVAAFTSKGDGTVFESNVHPTLSAAGGGQAGQGYPAVRQKVESEMVVRRLTPLECERLQGFPDNWTRIKWNGKPESECPDGHRYKACGNSMAVPVIRWLGERIQAVDAHVPMTPLPDEKSRVISDFKDGVVIAQDTMDEWFS